MSRNDYNDYSGGFITSWSGRSQEELIAQVAKEVGISETLLLDKVRDIKDGRYKKELTFWQILAIANTLKNHITE